MSMINCPECQNSVSDKASTCPHCGFPLDNKKSCPECGALVSKDESICTSCGYPFNKITPKVNVEANRKCCPICGSYDLLYTHERTSSAGSTIGIIVMIVFSILVIKYVFSLGFFDFIVSLMLIPIALILSTIGIISFKCNSNKNGNLRVTCKNCGHKIVRG
jgi:RNA polymerase subunit RPABC4/transcription elongation factor Spt4